MLTEYQRNDNLTSEMCQQGRREGEMKGEEEERGVGNADLRGSLNPSIFT